DLSDAIHVLIGLFSGGTLRCQDAADADDDGALTITDAIYLLEWLYRGGEHLPPPGELCGIDPTQDQLDCLSYGACPESLGACSIATPQAGRAPLEVSFDAPPTGGAPSSFAWSFGDGTKGTGKTARHTYGKPGTFTAVLTVQDPKG